MEKFPLSLETLQNLKERAEADPGFMQDGANLFTMSEAMCDRIKNMLSDSLMPDPNSKIPSVLGIHFIPMDNMPPDTIALCRVRTEYENGKMDHTVLKSHVIKVL